MHCVALLQQQLGKVAAVLASDAGDQRVFAVAHELPLSCRRHFASILHPDWNLLHD